MATAFCYVFVTVCLVMCRFEYIDIESKRYATCLRLSEGVVGCMYSTLSPLSIIVRSDWFMGDMRRTQHRFYSLYER